MLCALNQLCTYVFCLFHIFTLWAGASEELKCAEHHHKKRQMMLQGWSSKPEHGINLTPTLSKEVCILSVCMRWMYAILLLDETTDFIRIILQVFREDCSFSSIIVQCLLEAGRGSYYHKMSNVNNAETYFSDTCCRTEVDSTNLLPSQYWDILTSIAEKAVVRLQ